MNYHFSKNLGVKDFDEATNNVTASLKEEGFGVLTEIDVKKTLKEKIDVDFKKYKILGACNPHFAHKALQAEDKIGVFLPCNVIIEENDDRSIEVSAVNPIASMMSIKNDLLVDLATEVEQKMKSVIESL